ncbi:MAG TPA: ABC transporter substrate-binding protein [Longimicrobiaceae bacterium]|nr:ABC transporter substrate-binding protein [Longimicrobiaceae bacterium]
MNDVNPHISHRHPMRSPAPRAALAAAIVLAACGPRRDVAEERAYRAEHGTGDIVVGAAWPWKARAGLLYGQGMEMAVDEVNASGGIHGRHLRILREDDGESVDEGSLVAQRLSKDPDVVAVIGHLQSYVTVPAAAVYDLAGIPLVSPAATDPELTGRGYRRVFRATFTDARVGRGMADYAAAHGYRRVAIFYVRNPYGRGLANAFEERAAELQMEIAARQSYDPNADASQRGTEQIVADWKGLNLDAVFIAGEAPQGPLFVAELRRQGIRAPILGGDALGIPDALRVGGSAVEGTVVASAFHAGDVRPEVRRFVDAFRKRYGVQPDVGAALGYDAVGVLAQAMRRTPTPTPEHIAAALRSTHAWQGVTGPFTFDDHGDLVDKPVRKMVAHAGRWEYLDESHGIPGAAPAAVPARTSLRAGQPSGPGDAGRAAGGRTE